MDVPAQFADFIQHYGWLGVTVLIIGAWIFGIFLSRGEVNERERIWQLRLEDRDKALQEMTDDRNRWRDKAGELTTALSQLTNVLDQGQTGRRAR